MPDRRIERRSSIGPLDDEREGTAGALVTILHLLAGRALHPLLEPSTVDALKAGEGVATEGGTPMNGCPNVGAEHGPVNADDRISLGRQVKTTERRPQERTRWDEIPNHLWSGDAQRVAHEDGGTTAHSATEKKVEPNAVG